MLSKTTIGLPIHILALLLIPQNNACGGKTSTVVEKSSLPRVIERGDHYQKLAVDGDYVQSGMRFPETIGIFTRAQILDFESRELGHSVMYKSQMGTMLSVYVYGFGGDLDIEIALLLNARQQVLRKSNQFLGSG